MRETIAPTDRVEIMETSQYIEKREEVYRLKGSRVSLDSIVHNFLNGATAEDIARAFPVLSLEQVYGAITLYLAHRPEIDAYLETGRVEVERQVCAARDRDADFYRKIDETRLKRSA